VINNLIQFQKYGHLQKNGQDALFAIKKKKQPLTVSVKTKNQLISASSKKNDGTCMEGTLGCQISKILVLF
jgi:hypothetical protein